MIFQHSIVCLYGSPSKRRFNKHLLQEKNDERNSIPSRIYNVGGGGGVVVLGLGFVVERSVFTHLPFFSINLQNNSTWLSWGCLGVSIKLG